MSRIKASVVINTKDRFSRLYLVLKALEGQVDESIEVIVVYDGCSQSTLDLLAKVKLSYSVKEIFLQRNLGRASARNIGAQIATGDIIIFIDDDRVPCPEFIKKHIESHQTNCIVLGDRREIIICEDEITNIAFSNEATEVFLGQLESKASRALDSHDRFFRRVLYFRFNPLVWLLFYTGNVSMGREDLVMVGFFDENFRGWGYEDLEIGYRLYKKKIPFIVNKQIVNYHLAHEVSINNMHREALRNLSYFSKKVKGDLPAQFVICLLKIFMYIRLWRRYLIHATTLPGQSSIGIHGSTGPRSRSPNPASKCK